VDTRIVVYALIALAAILFIRRTLRIRSLKEYRPSELDQLLKTTNSIVLLDVRTAAERQTGSIKSSIHIPLQSLRTRFNELEKYKGREIVCYCQTGSRSVSAALLLRGKGFPVANLRGGMADWNFAHR
jgi:rhodanese-related sulfurtransferase